MVKKLKGKLLDTAAENGWDNVSKDPKVVKLQNRDSIIGYSVEAVKPDSLIAKIKETLQNFNDDCIVLDWFNTQHDTNTHYSIDAVQQDVDDVHESLQNLVLGLERAAEDYEMYISGMQLSRLLYTFTDKQSVAAELWHAMDDSKRIRCKRTGTGHATRWWYHKADVISFCERYLHGDVVISPPKRKLNGLYVFVGRSGVGKTAVMNMLQEQYGYIPAITCTDRPPRYKNEPGHTFLSETEFSAITDMIAPTTFSGHRYGITPESLDVADMVTVDLHGVSNLKWAYKQKNRPIHVIGLIAMPNELFSRMQKRGDSLEKTHERLEHDAKHFSHIEEVCDVLVKNSDLATTVSIVKALITNWERMDKTPADFE